MNLALYDYSGWRRIRLGQRLEEGLYSGLRNHLISVAVIAPNEDDNSPSLDATLCSLLRQTYRNVEVLVMEGPHSNSRYVEAFAHCRGLFFEPELSHLDILREVCLDRIWRGSHLMFARAGTVFDPDGVALLNVALGSQSAREAPHLVLCDHDRVIGSDEYDDPSFTPGWDPDLIQSVDYVDTAFLASRALIQRNRARASSCTSLHYWLRIIAAEEPDLATRHVTESLVHIPPNDVPSCPPAAVTYALPSANPDLAVIIPNRNRPELLEKCLGFMKFRKQFKPELIVVDNASDDPSVLAIYEQLREFYGARIVSMNQGFNFARMVNLGVAASNAETFILLNNDVEITAPGLVEQLLAHALRPEVGVVGTKLLNGDGTIQHAGILLQKGETGVNAMLPLHLLRGAARYDKGYLNALSSVRNQQAVTGALMASRREVFLRVGGFDEVHLPVEFNDVDYCLRVREAGYRVLCLPMDGIFHFESSTRGSELEPPPEVARMRQAAKACMAGRWMEQFQHDPYRNPWVELGDVAQARFPWSTEGAP